jgi:hypothetical protein
LNVDLINLICSYGVTLWEIYSDGEEPYGDIDSDDVSNLHNFKFYIYKIFLFKLAEMVIDGIRLECPEKCPVEVYGVMYKCWEEEAEDRIKFKDIFEFFHQYACDNSKSY